MAIYQLAQHTPDIDATAWVADSAQVIGRVRLGPQSSVWYGTVVRADNDTVTIGARSNIQDGSVVHVDPGFPLVVGEGVTVGHKVMLHGCTIGDGTLVGVGAVILNGAKIGRGCLVGAGAVVTEGKTFGDGLLILGAPAKAVKPLSPEQAERVQTAALRYVEQAARHRATARRVV